MYLLAKALPHTLVSDQNDEFKKLLAETEAKDIVAFATAVGQQAKEIDGKVCAKKKVHNSAGAGNGTTKEANDASNGGRWSCVDYSGTGSNTDKNRKMDPHDTKGLMWRFGDLSKHGTAQDKNSNETDNLTNRGWPGTGAKTNDTSDAMAEDIGKLQRPDKAKVAGLLSKTVSGAEVVEIRALLC